MNASSSSSLRAGYDEMHGPGLVDDLAQRIQLRIMSGDVPIGSWLRQETLATEFGVSRTPIREALRKLQAAGLVEVMPHRGALVHGPTARDLREAYLIRANLEGLAAELAAEWIRDDQLIRLREAEDLFRRAVEEFLEAKSAGTGDVAAADADWVRANDQFHEVVQEAAGNDRLQRTIADLHRSFPRNLTWSALSKDSRLLEENVRQHRDILEAIEERDPARARERMTEHVQRAGALVATWFERLQSSAAR